MGGAELMQLRTLVKGIVRHDCESAGCTTSLDNLPIPRDVLGLIPAATKATATDLIRTKDDRDPGGP
jgi:hypothetical protein